MPPHHRYRSVDPAGLVLVALMVTVRRVEVPQCKISPLHGSDYYTTVPSSAAIHEIYDAVMITHPISPTTVIDIAYRLRPDIICQPASNIISRRVPATIRSGFLLRARLYFLNTNIVIATALFSSVTQDSRA